jgi:Delta14-sterol reductase
MLWCLLALIGWFLLQVSLERFLPCELVLGAPIQQHPDKIRLTYRINGHLAFWCTLLLCTVGWPVHVDQSGVAEGLWQLQAFPYWSLLYEHFAELGLASILLCFALSAYLYLDSYSNNHRKMPMECKKSAVRFWRLVKIPVATSTTFSSAGS